MFTERLLCARCVTCITVFPADLYLPRSGQRELLSSVHGVQFRVKCLVIVGSDPALAYLSNVDFPPSHMAFFPVMVSALGPLHVLVLLHGVLVPQFLL